MYCNQKCEWFILINDFIPIIGLLLVSNKEPIKTAKSKKCMNCMQFLKLNMSKSRTESRQKQASTFPTRIQAKSESCVPFHTSKKERFALNFLTPQKRKPLFFEVCFGYFFKYSAFYVNKPSYFEHFIHLCIIKPFDTSSIL